MLITDTQTDQPLKTLFWDLGKKVLNLKKNQFRKFDPKTAFSLTRLLLLL